MDWYSIHPEFRYPNCRYITIHAAIILLEKFKNMFLNRFIVETIEKFINKMKVYNNCLVKYDDLPEISCTVIDKYLKNSNLQHTDYLRTILPAIEIDYINHIYELSTIKKVPHENVAIAHDDLKKDLSDFIQFFIMCISHYNITKIID